MEDNRNNEYFEYYDGEDEDCCYRGDGANDPDNIVNFNRTKEGQN